MDTGALPSDAASEVAEDTSDATSEVAEDTSARADTAPEADADDAQPVDTSSCMPLPEACGNGVDDDCDGSTDEGCAIVGVTLSAVSATLSSDAFFATVTDTPVGPPSPPSLPVRVELGVFPIDAP